MQSKGQSAMLEVPSNEPSSAQSGKDISNSSKRRRVVVFKVPCFASARVQNDDG